MKKMMLMALISSASLAHAVGAGGGKAPIKKMQATCYFTETENQVLEATGYANSVKGDLTQAAVSIYSTNAETGAKIKLLNRYTLKYETPANAQAIAFKFSNKSQKVSLEMIEASADDGMSTLTEKDKKQSLNCDIEQ